jgi:hypothetical protein
MLPKAKQKRLIPRQRQMPPPILQSQRKLHNDLVMHSDYNLRLLVPSLKQNHRALRQRIVDYVCPSGCRIDGTPFLR